MAMQRVKQASFKQVEDLESRVVGRRDEIVATGVKWQTVHSRRVCYSVTNDNHSAQSSTKAVHTRWMSVVTVSYIGISHCGFPHHIHDLYFYSECNSNICTSSVWVIYYQRSIRHTNQQSDLSLFMVKKSISTPNQVRNLTTVYTRV